MSEDFELAEFHGRTAEDVAKDITKVHEEITTGNGKIIGSYVLKPASPNEDALYIVAGYPEV